MNQTLLSIMTPSFFEESSAQVRFFFSRRKANSIAPTQMLVGVLGLRKRSALAGKRLTRSSSGSRFPLTAPPAAQKFLQFFVSLNGSASGRSNGGTNSVRESGADRGERCAASKAFNGSSPTANLVSIIKEQGMS
jgi:hypothetical protein